MDARQSLELAYGKGNVKKWALEKAIIETLYDTEPQTAIYLKLENLENLDFDEETETEYIVKFGYLWRLPKTEIDLHIMKRDGKLYLKKEGVGFGYEAVENEVIKYLLKQKTNKNLYLRSNYNGMLFLIR